MDDYLDHLLSSASWSDVNAKEGSYWGCNESGQVDGPLSNSIVLDEDDKDSSPMSMINSNQSLESLAAQDTSTILLGGESDHGLDQEFLSSQLQKDGQECNEHTLSKGMVNGGLEAGTMGVQSNMVIPIPGSINLDSRNQIPLVGDVAVSSLSFLESGHNGYSGDEPSEFHRPLGDLQTLSSIPQLWPLPSYDGISSLPPVMGEDRIHGFDLQGKHVNNDADLTRNRYVGIDNILQYDNLSTSVTRKGTQDVRYNFFSNFAAGPQISMTSAGLNSLPQTAQTTISGGCNGTAKPRPRARRGQATDPHSIAERLRREKIAERMKNLQELVPNSNKTDKASMLDEIIDYVKFLQLQVKVLSMSRLGAAGAVVPLITDSQAEGSNGLSLSPSAGQVVDNSQSPDQVALEQEIVKLMESSVTMAMQYLQSKGLCLMPIALAAAISSGGKTSSSSPVSEDRIKFGSTDNLVQNTMSSSNSSSSLPGGTWTHQISSDDNNNGIVAKLGRGGITANGCNRAVKQEEVKSTAHTASAREIKPKI